MGDQLNGRGHSTLGVFQKLQEVFSASCIDYLAAVRHMDDGVGALDVYAGYL